jgi:hypothetical protein
MLGTGKYMKTCDLSNDGQTLLLVLEDPENSDIYISHNIRGRWSKAEEFGKEINSKANETHASFSADGRIVYFTSDRKGGEGDLDIYRSVRDPSGGWQKPVNLGPMVNTPYNEETPFVTDDGQTLYFSSEGHDGIGGFDVFRYDLGNPETGSVNIGYPLNTTDNNLFYVPFGDGNSAYYSLTGTDSYGGRDIYLVGLQAESRKEEEAAIAAAIAAVKAEEEKEVVEAVEAVEAVKDVEAVEAVKDVEVVEAVKDVEAVEDVKDVEAVEDVKTLETAVAVNDTSPKTAAEPVVEPVEETAKSYAVQFMALRKPVDLTYFTALSDIFVTYSEDQWYRYTWRTTIDAIESDRIKNDLIEKGFSDAFIRRKNIIPFYTIQVMAVPGPVIDLTKFTGINNISVSKGKDKFCRYTTGEFETRAEAMAWLDNLKRLGYHRAFVRKVKILQR